MAGRFSVDAVFRAIDKVTAPVSKMQRRIGKFTRSMERGFLRVNRIADRFGSTLKRASLTAAAALGITGAAFGSVLGTGADFEQAITNVGAVSLKSRDQIAELESKALELGRTTKFTATQSAEAMEIMAKAGFSNQEILQSISGVLSAAAASGMEIADVADVVSNALKGMGMEASKAGEVADILALASSRTNSSIGSLGESLKNVSSTARQLNIPIQDTVAAVALLQDVGLDASVAGSAFNVMLTKMAAPTAGMQKKMKRFGISFKDAKGNMLPFGKVLQQLNVASKKAGGNFDKVAFLAELVGLRGQKAAANLADLWKQGKIDKLVKELSNAKGAAEKMANIRMNTVQGSLLLLGSAIDGVKVKIFGMNNGPLKTLIDNMTKWVSQNEDLIATEIGNFLLNIFNNLDKIATTFKNIVVGLGSFIALSIALKGIAAILGVINLLVAANPIVLLIMAAVTAVAALSGALTPVWETLKSITSGITSAYSTLKSIFGGSTDVSTNIVSPQERTAAKVNENVSINKSEVTIKAGEGTQAEVTKGKLSNGLLLQNSGAM